MARAAARNAMMILYDLLYLLLLCLGWPYLIYRRWKRGPGSVPLFERLGNVPSRPVAAHCVWIHGVSLGEINATRTIVEQLRLCSPTTSVVVSSTTQTGVERARQLYPKHVVFRFPLDFSPVLRRVMRRIRPSVIVLMELEVWPNLIEVSQRLGVPVIVANGRITEQRSVRWFRHPLLRPLAQRMFARLAWVGAQDEAYAQRFAELGVPRERIEITGSLKYDAAEVADWIEGQEELAREMGIARRRPLWVCGSTGPGEEALILDAYGELLKRFPELQLAIVPRHPERFDEVAALIVQRGFACLRRSTGAPLSPGGAAEAYPVFLGDTMGELRKFYALARVVLVGRTLAPLGGSDVMEVAGLAQPIVVGPHTENFAEAVGLLLAGGGCVQLRSGLESGRACAAELSAGVADVLADAEAARRLGEAARQTIVSRRGATRKTVDRILRLLEEA